MKRLLAMALAGLGLGLGGCMTTEPAIVQASRRVTAAEIRLEEAKTEAEVLKAAALLENAKDDLDRARNACAMKVFSSPERCGISRW